jgi:hypothetical protein
MDLVRNSLLGRTNPFDLASTVSSSNQLPQRFSFNESAKPPACPIET